MLSGMIRYACMLFFALALLNAPYYTPAEIAGTRPTRSRWFGGGLEGFSGDFFPRCKACRKSVFKESFLGPHIKDYLGALLINTAPVGRQMARRRRKNSR